ncbi:hypothetical protein ACJJTC_000522 [Scirpophaga incertulas]
MGKNDTDSFISIDYDHSVNSSFTISNFNSGKIHVSCNNNDPDSYNYNDPGPNMKEANCCVGTMDNYCLSKPIQRTFVSGSNEPDRLPPKIKAKSCDEKVKMPRIDWKSYHCLEVIYSFLDELEYNYPSTCTAGAIGKSLEGRDIKVLKISNSNAKNQCVWIDAGIHAREWIAPAVATYIANHIARNFNILPPSVCNRDWYFMPVVNPDGYVYSHTVDRMWRKNRAFYAGETVGVDLNRNFSFGWGGRGSSDVPKSVFYRGPAPFSEPESSTLRDMLTKSGINFKVYITLHSYGQVIVLPFSCRDELCPDYMRLLEGAMIMSKAINKCNGNIYKVGISKDVMYGASGTSNDFSYGAAKIPFCYLIELQSKEHKFKVPNEKIEETGNEILNSRTQVWEVRFTKEGQRHFIKTLDTVGAINIWKEEQSCMDILVEGPRAGQVAGILHERDIAYSIAIGDVALMIEKEQGSASSIVSRRISADNRRRRIDWTSYHRLNTIYNFMDDLVTEYPYLCTVIVIGRSSEGRDIKVLRISNGNPENIGVWIDGGIHPREWISVAVVTFIADKLVRTYCEQSDSVTSKDWYILPVMNPDGYEYTHTHDRMWRKNRTKYGECVGVDLNRNFSYGWGEKEEEGSSNDPGNIFYRGPNPFSEPETAAVKRTILESDTTFKVFISFHSYGEVIIFPWGYTGDPCPDYAIFESSGHTYKVGSTKDLMYFAAGTSVDWSYAVANIPYSYMVELRGKKHRFLVPKEEIISTACESMSGVIKLMDFVDRRLKKSGQCICVN